MTPNKTERQAIEARYEAELKAIVDRYLAELKPIYDRYKAEVVALKAKCGTAR